MSINEILEQALELKSNDRFTLVDELIKSLDKPDDSIEKVWEDEAVSRLDAYRRGELKTVSEEEFFKYDY